MKIDEVLAAYSAGDNTALSEALDKFLEQLALLDYCDGPVNVVFQLQPVRSHILAILNKVATKADAKGGAEKLAYQAGRLSTYVDLLTLITNRDEVNSADTELSNLPDPHGVINSILCCSHSYAGARTKELVNTVARMTQVKKNSVTCFLEELIQRRLVRKKLWKGGIISYRITHLGEAVLMKRSQLYQLENFVITDAASNPELRAVLQEEIKRTWPSA